MMEKNPNAVGAAIDFVRLFVSQSEFMSLKEDENFMNGDTLLCKVDILVGDKDAGQVLYSACGSGTDENERYENAYLYLHAQLMQRLTMPVAGYIVVDKTGGLDLSYVEQKIGVVVHDKGSRTITLTVVSK
jgi:hypothetical protein